MELQRGIYQHYKGQLYQVFHVATHSETEENWWYINVSMGIIRFGYALNHVH